MTHQPVVGTRVAFAAHFLGRRLAYTYEIVELMHPERMVMRTAEGPVPMETTYTWTATPEGFTSMTLRNRGTPSESRSLMVRFMADAMRGANGKDLARLKALLEGGGR
jgi:hypothetical protein